VASPDYIMPPEVKQIQADGYHTVIAHTRTAPTWYCTFTTVTTYWT